VDECKPLAAGIVPGTTRLRDVTDAMGDDPRWGAIKAGASTRPLFGSTQAHFVGYVGCVNFPQSIRQGDTGRCDQNGLG